MSHKAWLDLVKEAHDKSPLSEPGMFRLNTLMMKRHRRIIHEKCSN